MADIYCYDSLGNLVTRLYQWDINQYLTVRGVPTSPLPVFQFANKTSDTALSVTPTVSDGNLVVLVPNILLEKPEPIFAFIHRTQVSGAGRTIGEIRIPVKPRIKPDTTEYIETNND